MVNFRNKISERQLNKKINPTEIYDTLDRKSIAGPLRPTQKSILEKWFDDYKDNKDVIIKLHTGEGKTLIGLLILQSRINMDKGPCMYVCPNKYLVKQVQTEAEKFGIPHEILIEESELPHEFESGKKILITHVHKVFNGKSIFGIGTRSFRNETILLDDAHTCISAIKDSFTIKILKKENKDLYNKIISLFEDDLKEQGEGSFLDLKEVEYSTIMAVPYWAWYDKKSELLSILSHHKEEGCIKYCWDLIKDTLEKYDCYLTGNRIEISPHSVDTKKFGVFSNSSQRILMSATTQDDAFFIKGLDFSVEAVKRPLINNEQKWSGEKMLILPQLIDDSLDPRLVITRLMAIKHDKFGIVSIVPNTKKANYYSQQGGIVSHSGNIFEEIDNLKKGIFEKILVLNNRYDGIDLPDETCRILILDSKPYSENLCDQYEELCRPDSDIINKKIAQKIEQGLGRTVRGEKDFCVILILGNDIIKFLRSRETRKYFSEQTRKQIDIGLDISDSAKKEVKSGTEPFYSLVELIAQCLKRDEDWKMFYVTEMNKLNEDEESLIDYTILEKEREIEKNFLQGEFAKAFELTQRFIDTNNNLSDYDKGWYLQQLARYSYYIDKSKYNNLQKSAFKLNNELLKPKEGISYSRVSYIDVTRTSKIKDFLNNFKNYDELALTINEALDNLSFGINSDKFEAALQKIGEFIGFISERPDKEIKKGPDNLWCCSDDEYMIFECKNEVDERRQAIKKSEAGQMNNHCGWFESEYGDRVKVYRFMIIPTKKLEYAGNFTHSVKIIRKGNLNEFKKVIKEFLKELAPFNLRALNDEKIHELIDKNKLYPEYINDYYSEEVYCEDK